jgi:F-type H+-transporting ATPase subunit delta
MTIEGTRAYAQAVVVLARGESALDTVADELLTIARVVGDNDELRRRLTDEHLPVAHRLAFVESDALRAAHPATRTALAMLIAADRAGELTTVAEEVANAAASARDEVVAEVRVAVPLDERREQALKEALERATGKKLDLKVYVDETVVGGVRARIGDTVIDGSVARRLEDLRTRASG